MGLMNYVTCTTDLYTHKEREKNNINFLGRLGVQAYGMTKEWVFSISVLVRLQLVHWERLNNYIMPY